MIIGIGNDLIDIRRIEKTLERFGDRFVDRVFTDVERTKSDRRQARRDIQRDTAGSLDNLPWNVITNIKCGIRAAYDVPMRRSDA